MAKLFLLVSSILMISYSPNNKNGQIYWVNSYKVSCEGLDSRQCLQIQKGGNLDPEKWGSFYSSIGGFEYQPGYIYKLRLKGQQIPSEQVPADGSSIRYTLVDILDKQRDAKLRINDIWVLESMRNKKVDFSVDAASRKRAQIEFNLNKMSVTGNNGCNNFHGGIKYLDAKKLALHIIAITPMACHDMEIPDHFNTAINEVAAYSINNLKLNLYDKNKNNLLQFRKVD